MSIANRHSIHDSGDKKGLTPSRQGSFDKGEKASNLPAQVMERFSLELIDHHKSSDA